MCPVITGMQKVASAYTKTETKTKTAEENGRDFLQSSEVLFLDKKRAAAVLRPMGIYVPINILRNGYIGSISYSGRYVNINGVPFSAVIGERTAQRSARDATAITDREILAHTLGSAAQTQMERTLLARYRAHAEELRKLEGQITYNRNMLKAVENGNAKATQTEITRMRSRVNGYARLADREETMLRSLAKIEALQAVLARERTYIEQQGGSAVLFSYHQHTFLWISFSSLIYYVII